MKKYILTSLIAACTLLYLPVLAQQARQLTWDDLIPAHLLAGDPLEKLSPDQKDMVYWVINMLQTLPKRGPQTEEDYKQIDELMPSLRKAGIDIVKVQAKIKEIQTSIVKELDGQLVRMPGYLLPLEVSSAKVTEFLLVPYVGACIHVPPPPPNQIIYVKAAQDNGYESKTIFEPVWVTGVISVKSMSKELYLVDGSSGIDIGYGMQANKIEPYKE
ncbi:MAG: DUF3299 domain-containing protein [Desulfobacterales bacterium]|jgi:hypothetical protein